MRTIHSESAITKAPGRVPLVQIPTPLHRLSRLSDELGIELWIKRDDLTGLAGGGNKGRKLEYLVFEAVSAQAEVIVSCGSMQSNFLRQLAAAASVVGMKSAGAAMALPYSAFSGRPAGGRMRRRSGNALLSRLVGMDLRVYPDGTWEDLYAHQEELAREYERKGMRVHRIPVGGSSALGAYAFSQAAGEVPGFDCVVTASSSGSTHAGLGWAFRGSRTRVIGISCDPEPELRDEIAALAAGLDALTGESKGMRASDFRLEYGFVGPGYGVPSAEGNRAIRLMARREGIFLDPIYTGKAFAGLVALAKRGEISGRVLFWHTGGFPGLFAFPPR